MSFNKFIGVGNLTRDPELKRTQKGTPVAKFTVAINTKYKNGNEAREDTLFLDTVVFGKQAEICEKKLKKGSTVLVDGRLKEKIWEKEEGDKHRKVELLANAVRFLKGKKENSPADELEGDELQELLPDETETFNS